MNSLGAKFQRIFALTIALLVVVVIGVAWSVCAYQNEIIASNVGTKALQAAQSVQGYMEEERRQHLQEISKGIVGNPGFVSYITQALSPNVATGAAVDVVSIRDLIEERRKDVGVDVAAIVQLDGHLIALTGDTAFHNLDVSRNPTFALASHSATPVSYLSIEDNHPSMIVLTPILHGADLEAFLLTGMKLDAAFTKELAHVSQAETALVTIDGSAMRVLASSLDDATAAQLTGALAAKRARSPAESGDAAIDVDLGSRHWSMHLQPLADSGDKLFLAALLAPSANETLSHALMQPLLIAAGLLLLIGLAIATLVWIRVVRPLAALSDLGDRVVAGDYALKVTPRGGALCRHLGATFSHLLQLADGYRPKSGMPRRRGTDVK